MLRRVIAILVLAMVLAGGAASARQAGTDSPGPPGDAGDPAVSAYTIRGIEVDISASDAAGARAEALAEARRLAFARIIARLVLAADRPRVPAPDDGLISSLISGIDIVSEQFSSRRYIARLDVHFRPEAMRAFFAAHALRYSETEAVPRPFLLFLRDGPAGAISLPGEERRRLLFSRADLANRLVRLEPGPSGLDAREIRQRLEAALRGAEPGGAAGDDDTSRAMLAAAAAASDVPLVLALVTAAAPIGPLPGRVRLDLVSTRDPALVFARRDALAPGLPFAQAAGEAAAALLAKALDVLDAAWRQATVMRPGVADSILLRIPSRTLAEILDGERALAAVPAVRGVSPVRIAIPESTLSVTFEGGLELLAIALAERGYVLHETADGFVLRRTAPAAGKPQPAGGGSGP